MKISISVHRLKLIPDLIMHADLKVSIITVVLNCEKYIQNAIESALNQTYPNIEYILIDGGSTDGTIEIINQYKSSLAYFISEKDKGIYNAMNKGILASTGDIIYFLHADDYLYDSKVIEDIVIQFNQKPDLELLYGNVEWLFFLF